MFGLFNKKKYEPNLTPEDKQWIDGTIGWLIQTFGMNHLAKCPFILPNSNNFPNQHFTEETNFKELLLKICHYWEVDPDEIFINFFDDLYLQQWENIAPIGNINSASGFFYKHLTTEKKRYTIQLAKSNLQIPELLIAILAHEIGHVKLIGGNFVEKSAPDMEALTDLSTIFFGFGIFIANTSQLSSANWIRRTGYLPDSIISYTNALLCYITNTDATEFEPYFNKNTKLLFIGDYNYLINTNDTPLISTYIKELITSYNTFQQIREGFKKNKFDEVISLCKSRLEANPRCLATLNNAGYAFLLKKNYKEAINYFTTAIEIDPFYDYALNNRGYCKLQLGDLENAYTDIYSAFEINPDNSFSWRNMAAFSLRMNDLYKALEYLEHAEKIEPKTELINFYLGHVHVALKNDLKSINYFQKSILLEEYNDSILDDPNVVINSIHPAPLPTKSAVPLHPCVLEEKLIVRPRKT
jgi:tetratricopeptide (TPR) repeat protein